MLFVGIDLAWSPRNNTSVAILEGNNKKAILTKYANLDSDEDIMNFVKENVQDKDAIIAIDAPLIVPNEKGRRLAEDIVGKLFRKFNAGAHPANRERLSQWSGSIRGEEISRLLEKEGFEHNPYIKKYEKSRAFYEVYPHPSMVVLFNLDSIIKYKAKPKRDYPYRWKEFKKYQKYMASLEKANPSVALPKEIINQKVEKLKGSSLKKYEDSLDAIFCAYISYYHWTNPEKCEVLGNMKEGYILTPIFDYMKKDLISFKSQSSLSKFA